LQTRHRRGRCIEGRPSIGTLEARTGAPRAAPGEYSSPTTPATAGLSVSPLPEIRGPKTDDRTLPSNP
jgi:hypothetical protein